jgi:hypothetical protein
MNTHQLSNPPREIHMLPCMYYDELNDVHIVDSMSVSEKATWVSNMFHPSSTNPAHTYTLSMSINARDIINDLKEGRHTDEDLAMLSEFIRNIKTSTVVPAGFEELLIMDTLYAIGEVIDDGYDAELVDIFEEIQASLRRRIATSEMLPTEITTQHFRLDVTQENGVSRFVVCSGLDFI